MLDVEIHPRTGWGGHGVLGEVRMNCLCFCSKFGQDLSLAMMSLTPDEIDASQCLMYCRTVLQTEPVCYKSRPPKLLTLKTTGLKAHKDFIVGGERQPFRYVDLFTAYLQSHMHDGTCNRHSNHS